MRTTERPYAVLEATDSHRQSIYRHRHEIYAQELCQHPLHQSGQLQDRLDAANRYLVVLDRGALAGFISITPPGEQGYSIDKYFDREDLPLTLDSSTFELRLLTVLPSFRSSLVAALLMFAALRWVESRGGGQIVAIGRREVREMYVNCGLRAVGPSTQAGAVTYDLLHAPVAAIREAVDGSPLPGRLEPKTNWQLDVPLRKPADCFHGGAFFEAIGTDFENLDRRREVINADVLDAWFPPAPEVMEALSAAMPWLVRTSPPTACEGLVRAIAQARGIPEASILVGAGSSDLIYRALPRWLGPSSTALLLDPTYGEYAHVLEGVVRCEVTRLPLERERGYLVDLEQLAREITTGPDLVILVNPNSPTGTAIDSGSLERLIADAPRTTRFWIDETYIDYAGGGSLEALTSRHENLVICKSMSKAYALSGARVAYLCASPHLLEELRAHTPPWVVGLPSQVAAVKALGATDYYRMRWRETGQLRIDLESELAGLGFSVTPGCANFVLAHLDDEAPCASASAFVRACRTRGLYLRDASPMGTGLGDRAVRFAVKDAETNRRMLTIVSEVLGAKSLCS